MPTDLVPDDAIASVGRLTDDAKQAAVARGVR